MGLTRTLCWLAFSSLIAAAAQPVRTTQVSAASASFAYTSDEECVQNEVLVFANMRTVASAKAPSTTAEVTYSRHRYDYCEDADLGTDIGTTLRPVFSGDLNTASLNTTIEGHTASGSGVTISFALVWEGRGDVKRQAIHPKNAGAGSAKTVSSENLSRNAVVTGTVDRQDIADSVVGASLHTTRRTIPR
jgi:hypothetical protein